MKVAVMNKSKRVIVCGDMTLIPGANYKEHGEVEHHKKMLAGHKDIELPKIDVDDDLETTTLGQYNAGDAIALVKETNDYDTLMTFQIEETSGKARKTVLEAIQAQIELNKKAMGGSSEE